MTGIELSRLLSDIRDEQIVDALPPALMGTPPASRRRSRLGHFMSSPVAAVILSVIVAGGVLTGIILAGQGGAGAPPVGAVSGGTTEDRSPESSEPTGTDDNGLPTDATTPEETGNDSGESREPDPGDGSRPNENDPGGFDTEEEPEPDTEIETRPPGDEETDSSDFETFPPDVHVEVPGLTHPVSVPQGSTVRSAQQSTFTATAGASDGSLLDLQVRIYEATVPEINRFATTDAVYMDICDPATGEILEKRSFFGFTTVIAGQNGMGNSWAILNICPIRAENGSISLEILTLTYTLTAWAIDEDTSGSEALTWGFASQDPLIITCEKESHFATKNARFSRHLADILSDFRESSVITCTDRVLRESGSAPMPTNDRILETWDNRNYRQTWNAYRGHFPA